MALPAEGDLSRLREQSVYGLPALQPTMPIALQCGFTQREVNKKMAIRGRTNLATEPKRIHGGQATRFSGFVHGVRVEQHLHLVLQAADAFALFGGWLPHIDVTADGTVCGRKR